MWCRFTLAAFMAAFAGRLGFAQGTLSMTFTTAGSHFVAIAYPDRDIPTPVGVTSWWGAAGTRTDAHGGAPDVKVGSGIKLTFTRPNPFVAGVWTPGSVSSGVAYSPGDGCGSVGVTRLVADGYFRGLIFKQGVLSAESRFGANLAVVQHEDDIGWASYYGVTVDPWPFGPDGFAPIPETLAFGFNLPSSQDWPLEIQNGFWRASYTASIRDIATYDVDAYYSSDPAPLYSVDFGVTSLGPWAAVGLFNPPGFTVHFDETAEQIGQRLLTAMTNGWTGDLPLIAGNLDFRGQQVRVPSNLTIGYKDEAEARVALPPVPEPSTLLAIGVGVAALAASRRRR